jgi:hypothetical protein
MTGDERPASPICPRPARLRGADAAEALARLPRALLTGLQQLAREGWAVPQPPAAEGQPLVPIPVEALPVGGQDAARRGLDPGSALSLGAEPGRSPAGS